MRWREGATRLLVIMALLLFASSTGNAGVAVVCNTSSPIKQISASQAKRIFLGRLLEFNNGRQIKVVHQQIKSKIREEMAIKITGKSLSRLNSVWAKLFFSGKIARPEEFENDDEVIRWVQQNENAIGYIDTASISSDVTVLYRVE